MYVMVDTETGEELAYHVDNGKTLQKWKRHAERKGRKVEIKEQPEDAAELATYKRLKAKFEVKP